MSDSKSLTTLLIIGAATGGIGYAVGAGALAAGASAAAAGSGAAAGAAAGGATAAGAAAGGATAAGAAGTASFFTAQNLAIAVGAVGTTGATVVSGLQQASALRSQKAEQQLRQSAERTVAAEQEADRQRRVRAVISAQNAAFAARGIDPFSGSALRIAQTDISSAAREGDQALAASRVRQNIYGANASSYRRAATNTLLGTGFQAFGDTGDFAGRIINRGS